MFKHNSPNINRKIIISFLILIIISISVSASNIKFSFAVISDTPDGDCENPAIPTTTQGEALIQSVDFLNSKNPAFIIGVGDFISGQCKSLPGSAADQLNEFKTQFLDKINAPFVPVAGNHDFLNSASKSAWKTFLNENQDKFLDTYNSRTICDQQTSRFEYEGLGFVLIDPYNLGHKYALYNAELSCIDQLVSAGDVVFRHVTPYGVSCREKKPSNCGTSVLGDSGDVKDIEQLPQKLKQKNIKAIFSGHTHAFYHGMCDGLEFINTGTLGTRAEEFVKGWKPTDSTSAFTWVDVYTTGEIKTTFYLYNPSSKTFTPQTKQFPATVTSERISNPEKNDNEGVNAICTSIQPSSAPPSSSSIDEDNLDSGEPIVEEMQDVTPQIVPSKESGAAKYNPQTKSVQETTSSYTCLNSQRCKEIDEVWALKISMYVGNNINQIWDTRTSPQKWKNFAEVYSPPAPEQLTTLTQKSLPKYSGTGKCFSQAQSTSKTEADYKVGTLTFQGNTIKENKLIIPLLKKIDQEITAKNLNYPITINSAYSWRCINSPKLKIVDKINCLDNKGIAQRSKHSYGVAIDINLKTNPFCLVRPDGTNYYKTKEGKEVECKKYSNGKYYDMPEEIIQIFKANDFSWGGDWSGAKDYMHFDWKGNYGDFKGNGNIESCSK